MCKDPIRGMSWVRLIMNHQRTSHECAADMGMTPEDVNQHIYHHVSDHDVMNPDDPEYIRKKLIKFLTILELWLDRMIIDNNQGLDRATMEIALKLMGESGKLFKIVGEIDGQINRADPKLQIINITNDYKRLTNVIMMEMCDECRPKALAAVEAMQVQLPSGVKT